MSETETKQKTIKAILSENDIKIDAEILKHLKNIAKKSDKTNDEVAKLYVKQYKIAKRRSKNPAKTALVRTRKNLNKSSFKGSSTIRGIIVGKSNRVNDMSGRKLKERTKEYNKMIKNDSEEDIESIEISAKEFFELYQSFKEDMKKHRKIKELEDKIEQESETRDLFEVDLNGRSVIIGATEGELSEYNTRLLKDSSLTEEEIDKKLEEFSNSTRFIDVIKSYNNGKSPNFGFGEILKSEPQRPFMAFVLDKNDKPKFVTVNVKQTDRIKKLMDAPFNKPLDMKIVNNDDKKWYVLDDFDLTLSDTDYFGKTDDDITNKIMSYYDDYFPLDHIVDVENLNEWEINISKQTNKKNHLVVIRGIVESIYINSDDSKASTIVMAPDDEEDFNEDEEDDFSTSKNTVKCSLSSEFKDLVDFDEYSYIYVIGEAYRPKAWDSANRKPALNNKGEEYLADMPVINVWGVFADPDSKTTIETETVTEENYETVTEKEEEEEDDDYISDEDDE